MESLKPVPAEALLLNREPQPLVIPAPPPDYLQPRRQHSLHNLWSVLKKRRWVAITTVVIVMTLVTIASLRATPMYEATGRIAINRESSDTLGFKDVAGPSDDDNWDYNVAVDTQVRILQSDGLALAVIDAIKLGDNPKFAPLAQTAPPKPSPLQDVQANPARESVLLHRLRDGLLITKIPRTRIVEISFMSQDPRLSAEIVNVLINTYIEQNFKTKYESTMQTSEWLKKQLVDLEMKVESSQEKLVRYQRENDIIGIDDKQNITTAKLNELNQQLTAAQGERIQKQAAFEQTRAGNFEGLPGAADDRVLEKLKEQQADLQGQYAQASVQFGPAYPKVQALDNQIQQVDKSIQSEYRRLVSRIQNEYRAAMERERMLRDALERQKQEANKLNQSAIQYNLLKREVETNRTLYEGLLQKMKEASVTAGLKSGNIRIVDVARVPIRPAKPNIPMNLALGMALSITGAIVLALVVESLDNAVQQPDDVTLISGLPPLGIIPLDSRLASAGGNGRRKQLPAASMDPAKTEVIPISRPRSQMAEAYRALRTSIMLSSVSAPPKVILITSGLPQEGKSTTSINTAAVLAQTGRRVLLIDADLRRPSLHRLLKSRPVGGLSDLLAGAKTFEEVAIALPDLPNVTLIPGGTCPPYPAELLGSEVMKKHLDDWRGRFDHIVIDTPPALTVTDPVLLSPEADSVIIVIRAGQTTREALRRTCDLFAQVNARMGGVLLNAVDFSSNSGSYYSSYYYGSKYGSHYTDEGD